MKKIIYYFLAVTIFISCNNTTDNSAGQNEYTTDSPKKKSSSILHFRGALTGGMKGDSIFFDVNADKLENLMFKGYWYCDGKLTQERAAGPEGSFTIADNKIDNHISEPPNGGATAWRFDLKADIGNNEASGTFRMNINALGCNTGTLQWTAVPE